MDLSLIGLALVCFVGSSAAPAAAVAPVDAGAPAYVTADMKELHWRELVVTARLDAEGQLHVTERHQMVFTGLWNGGERAFRVSEDQDFELRSLTRIDGHGKRTQLLDGDTDLVDRYDLSDNYRLRWRSRLPTDAIFDHEEIGYEIEYTLSDILVPVSDGRFLLDHDFAFLRKVGDIRRFRLHLELDPGWRGDPPGPIDADVGPLRPSDGFALKLPLEAQGATYAPSQWKPLFRKARSKEAINLGLALLIPVVVIYWMRRRLKDDRERGVFEPVPAASEIDREWLVEHVMSLKPELLSAAYYGWIGRPQVAALFARLEQEGKIRLSAASGANDASDFELELLVNRRQLVGYEHEFINSLMLTGTRTTRAAVRNRYSRSGFNPANTLREPLAAELTELLGPGDHGGAITEGPLILGFFTLAGASFGGLWVAQSAGFYQPMGCVLAGTVFYLFGIRFARRVYGELEAPVWPLARHLIWIGIWSLIPMALLVFLQPSQLVAVVIFVVGLWIVRTMLQASKPPGSKAGIAFQKRLNAVQQYFIQELERPEPAIDNAWFPHLVGLGLSPVLSQWSEAFGGSVERKVERSSVDTSGPAVSAAAESPRWTGGGGAFGGAGASGSWVAAAEGLAAGVAGRGSGSSSSSGGSSSRSGSSSSGGGSGGGW